MEFRIAFVVEQLRVRGDLGEQFLVRTIRDDSVLDRSPLFDESRETDLIECAARVREIRLDLIEAFRERFETV